MQAELEFDCGPAKDLLRKAGSRHRYQWYSYLIYSLIWALGGAIELGVYLLLLDKPFRCADHQGQSCREYVCALPHSQWCQYIPQAPATMRCNFDPPLVCDYQDTAFFLQSCLPLGSAVGLLFLAQLADNKGRKFALILGWVLTAAGLIGSALQQNIWLFGGSLFLVGGVTPSYILNYSMLSETVTGCTRRLMLCGLQAIYPLGACLFAAVLYWQQSWQPAQIYVVLIPSLVALLLLFFLIQSPQFYLQQKLELRALAAFNKIARFNGRPPLQEADVMAAVPKNDFARVTVYDLFRTRQIAWLSVIIQLTFFTLGFIYYGENNLLDRFGTNVYLNEIEVSVAASLGSLLACMTVHLFPLRQSTAAGALLVALLYFSSTVFSEQLTNDSQQYVHLAIRFIINFIWPVFFAITAQLYPARVHATALGLGYTMTALGAVFSPYLQLLANPYWLMGALTLLCGALALLLPFNRPESHYLLAQTASSNLTQ